MSSLVEVYNVRTKQSMITNKQTEAGKTISETMSDEVDSDYVNEHYAITLTYPTLANVSLKHVVTTTAKNVAQLHINGKSEAVRGELVVHQTNVETNVLMASTPITATMFFEDHLLPAVFVNSNSLQNTANNSSNNDQNNNNSTESNNNVRNSSSMGMNATDDINNLNSFYFYEVSCNSVKN